MKTLLIGLCLGFTLGWFALPFPQTSKLESPPPMASSALESLLSNRTKAGHLTSFLDFTISEDSAIWNAATWEAPDTTAGLLVAIRDLEKIGDPMISEMLLIRILTKWIQVDPKAGFDAILGESNLNGRDRYLSQYVQAWAATDAESAVERIRSLEANEPLRQTLAKELAQTLSSSDPRLAIALVGEFDVSFHGGSSVEKAYRTLAEGSPLKAAELAFAVKGWQAKTWAVTNVYHAWSRSDPEEAIAHLRAQKVTNSNHAHQWWNTIFNGWAETDPQAALAALDTEAPANNRVSLRHEVVKTWAQAAPEDAMAWLSEFGDEAERKQLYGALCGSLAKDHPQIAIDALLASGEHRHGETLFRTFAKECWEGTMTTLGDWEDADLRAKAAMTMLTYAHENHRLLGEDEKPLLAWLSESPSVLADARAGRPQYFVKSLSEESLAYLSETHPDTYATLLPSIIRSQVTTDPAGALELFDQLDENALGSREQQLRQEAVILWARQEPQAAAEWAERLPESAARDDAFLNLTSAWVAYDPTAARAWMEAQPAGGARDFAAQAFAESMAARDLESAVAAAELIVDQGKRDEILTNVWEQRLAANVTTARKEVEEAHLPPNVRIALEAKAQEEELWRALGQ